MRYNVKPKVRHFLYGHFDGQLDTCNADLALYFFLAGRYEYLNKGGVIYTGALIRLNEMLKVG